LSAPVTLPRSPGLIEAIRASGLRIPAPTNPLERYCAPIEFLPKQREFMDATESEVLYSGAFGAGKTRALCYKAVKRAAVPGARELLCRKTLVSLKATTLVTLLEGDGEAPPVLKRGTYDHNKSDKIIRLHGGGEIRYFGLDDHEKLGSYNGTGVGIDEMVEILAEDHRQLLGRYRLNVAGVPQQMYGACNPGAPQHHLAQRYGILQGSRAIDKAKAEPDTRVIFTSAAENTHLSAKYLNRIARFEGVARQRYYEGLWVGAEGLILGTYDAGRHRIEAELVRRNDAWWLHVPSWETEPDAKLGPPDVRLDWFVCCLDFGFRAPGCMQVWGVDRANRAFRVREVYRTVEDIDWWSEWATRFGKEFDFRVGLADHDPASIKVLNKRTYGHGGRAVWRPWTKNRQNPGEERAGFDQLRVRFRDDAAFLVQGPGVFPAGFDATLQDEKLPVCLEDEIPQLVFGDIPAAGTTSLARLEGPDPKCADHAVDAARGMAAFVAWKDLTPPELRPVEPKVPDPEGDHEAWQRTLLRERGIDPDNTRRRRRR
jgi:terminase large subunit-like protein